MADGATPDAAPLATGVTEVGGTAYMFGYEPGAVAGATIAMAELPNLTTVTGADGRWRMVVPRGVPLTPCATHSEFAPMCLQTFTFVEALPLNLNLQMVPPFYFNAFAGLLGRQVDPPVCQLVTTVNTKDVFLLDRKQFYGYGAHGVAGATCELDPPVAQPVYFSAVTIPKKELAETTTDGGVVWTNLPAGKYVVRTQHPTKKFADFIATCEPGRFINACPPWGAREL